MEFEARFASEEDCRQYLFQLRWPDGFRWSELRLWKVVAFAKSAAAVRYVWAPNLGDRRDDLSGYAQSFAVVVSCDVVGHHPKDRSQRFGTSKSVGAEQLRKRLGRGCTKCAARWCGPGRDLLGRGEWQSMKATWADSKRACGVASWRTKR